MAIWDFFVNLGRDVGQAAYNAGASVGQSLQQTYTPQPSPPPSVTTPSPQPSRGISAGADYTNVQIQQPSQPKYAPTPTQEFSLLVPAGNRAQREVQDVRSIVYDPVGGGVGGYVVPPSSEPGFVRKYGFVTTSGGPGALQSGRFSLTPLTPVVYTQASDVAFSPLANKDLAKQVLANPEQYSRVGAELYGGRVLPLDNRIMSPDTQMGRYPASSGNLANLASPTGVNLPKSAWADVPWKVEVANAPRFQTVGKEGVLGVPSPESLASIGVTPEQNVAANRRINYFGAEATMQPLKLPEGLRVVGETQTPSYEMGGGKQMWVLGAAGMAALPINAKGELSLGAPGSPEVQNLTGQPIPPKSAIGAFMDVFTMRSPLEYIPPVGVWNVLTRADPYLSGVIKANAGPLTTYATGPGKSTIIGGLMEPIIERPASTAGLAGAMYLGGALVSGVVSAVSPYVIPAIEAAPWGAGFLRALPAVTTIGMGAAAGGGVIVDVYSAQPAQRERVLGRDITTIGISAYSFMKGANPEWSLSETLRPATNTISDTAAGGYRRIDELIYGFRQQSAGFENIGIGGGARAGGIYTEPTFTNPPSPLSGGGGYPGISGENYPLGLPDLTGNLLSPKPISNFPGNVGGTLDIGQRAMMLAYGTTEPHFVETMTKMQALDYRSLNQKIFDIGEIRLTESRISGVGQFAPSLPTPSTKLEPFSFDIGWVESSLTKTPPYSGTKSEVIARQSETNIGFINNLIKGTPIPKTESQPQLQMQMEPALPSQSTRPYKPAQMDWNQARKLSKTELQVEPQLQMQMEPVISTQLSSQYKPAQMDWNRARKILKTERQLQTQGGIAVTSISNAISPHTAQRSSRSSFIGGALSLGLPKILETPPAETRRSYPIITPGITAINFPKTTPAPSPGLTPSQNPNVWPFPYETPQTTPKIKPPIPQVPIIPILPGLPSGPGGPSDLRMRRSRRFLETFPVGLDISFMGGWYSGKKPRKKSYKARRKKK